MRGVERDAGPRLGGRKGAGPPGLPGYLTPDRAGRHALGGAGAQGVPHSGDRVQQGELGRPQGQHPPQEGEAWGGRTGTPRGRGTGEAHPRAATRGAGSAHAHTHTCVQAPGQQPAQGGPGGWTHGICGGTGRTRRTGGCPRNQAILGVAKGRPDPPSKPPPGASPPPATQPRTRGREDRGPPGLSSSLEAPRWTSSGHPASGLLGLTLTTPRTDK